MKRVLLLFSIIILFTGCSHSTPKDIAIDECEMGGATQSGRSARIGDYVVYDCTSDYGTFITSGDQNTPTKLKDISEYFAIDKISSSNQYFYISGRELSDVWGGTSNVLVVDKTGTVIKAIDCSCIWVYACGDLIYGYYNGHDDSNDSDGAVGWASSRMEVTHYIDEKDFLQSNKDRIETWNSMTGEQCSINDKKWFLQKDSEHSVPYYTDTVYYDAYDVLKGMLYVDGKESSGLNENKELRNTMNKYIKQMNGLMEEKEKNFEISSWQFGSDLLGVCCVYKQSGGYLQHFTKDIEYSLTFRYNPQQDTIELDETYPGKEVSYYDENWLIYRKEKKLFLENLHTKETNELFQSDTHVTVDVSGDVVTVWDADSESGELNHSVAVILQ